MNSFSCAADQALLLQSPTRGARNSLQRRRDDVVVHADAMQRIARFSVHLHVSGSLSVGTCTHRVLVIVEKDQLNSTRIFQRVDEGGDGPITAPFNLLIPADSMNRSDNATFAWRRLRQ